MMSWFKKVASGLRLMPAFMLALLSLNSEAAQTSALPPPPLVASPVSSSGVLQVLLGLALVLAAIAGTAWLLKRFVPGQSAAGGVLKLVGGLMVGPKERLVLVEIGETWLLLGVAAGQVNTLHSMPKPQGGAQQVQPVINSAFSGWLKRALQ